MTTSARQTDMICVGPLDELRQQGVKVVHSGDRPIAVYAADGKVYAVDNRCPHMGFPLHRGTVKDGMLTCHWHQARFDLASGCTFDLFADDVPTYDTTVEDGTVFVSATPRQRPDRDFYLHRLSRGMEQSIGLIQGKSLIGLMKLGTLPADIIREVARFGSIQHDNWQSGMTLLAIVANLSPLLDERNAYFAMYRAVRQVAADCSDAPPRRPREPLATDQHDFETLKRWLRQWTLARHRDGAERVLLTAVQMGASPAQLTDMLAAAISDRIFPNVGHPFDFANKAIELLGVIGHEHAAGILPLLLRSIVGSRGSEEDAHWHHPLEIIEPLRLAEGRIAGHMQAGHGKTWTGGDSLGDTLLGDDPLAIIAAMEDALAAGATPDDLARRVAYAAALRLARFAVTNDVSDWFGPQHTFTYANAVHQAVTRSPTPDVVRAVFHAALAVYQDRFLNVPPAKVPGERDDGLDALPDQAQDLRDALLEQLDQRSDPDAAARLVARYVRMDRPLEPLIETLTFATAREDVDFHPMQVLEAGIRQLGQWPKGSKQREHILIGVVRQLAAFCPTRRGNLQTATIALRLHRGDRIYEED